ncbi:MAG: hypothetical protein U5O39_16455 [Gammaproteobacteria bacterium]|nr:hypothetical protein [Gammaproteobacteria bacterium]
MLWTIAMARIIFGAKMNIQAPPNLSPGVFEQIVDSGINDWGGVSPITPDFVNPEAPWPHLRNLAQETANAGKHLIERLAIYPDYAMDLDSWVDDGIAPHTRQMIDGQGFARMDDWSAGVVVHAPEGEVARLRVCRGCSRAPISRYRRRATAGEELGQQDVVRLLKARGD